MHACWTLHARQTDHSAAAYFTYWPLMLSLTLCTLFRPKTFLHGQAAAVGIAIFNGVGKPLDRGYHMDISFTMPTLK